MKRYGLVLAALCYALVVCGCQGSASDDNELAFALAASKTMDAPAAEDIAAGTEVTQDAYTAEEIEDILATISATLLEIPWQDMDWNAYADQLENQPAAATSRALTLPAVTVLKKDGLTVKATAVFDQLTKPAILLSCIYDGYKLDDLPLVTDRTLSGTLNIRVFPENILKLQLGIMLYTADDLAINGNLGFIPITTTVGVADMYLYYSLWSMKFLDDPAPSGTIVLNGLSIQLDPEWLAFFMDLLGV